MMARKRDTPSRVKLTDCVECKQPFVQVDMDQSHEAENDMWFLFLWCGNCFATRELLVTQARADEFGDDLIVYERMMQLQLKYEAQDNFENDVERFIHALRADAILPEDFGRVL